MRRLILTCAAIAFGAAATAVFAQCPPLPAPSTCVVEIIDLDACPTVFPPTLVWCPDGDMSRIALRVTALGASGLPCAGCDLNIRVLFDGMAYNTANQIWVCGADPGGFADFTVTTDAAGEATVEITGGGCGCIHMQYWVESFSCGGTMLCQGEERFCLRSPDITGDGTVNFFDTFQFLPQLSTGQGYCADYNCDNTVNFFDTFQFLPHLSGGHTCVGNPIPIVPCTIPCS